MLCWEGCASCCAGRGVRRTVLGDVLCPVTANTDVCCAGVFGEEQHYIVFETEHGGVDLEHAKVGHSQWLEAAALQCVSQVMRVWHRVWAGVLDQTVQCQ